MSGRPVKISIIIPVYNTEPYLSACLSSCISQTLYDIEIICVNDGSADGSLEILRAFAEKDYRVKVIDKPNGGLSSARNAGILASDSEFLMFLDSDDALAPVACERVWKESLDHKSDIITFGANIFPDTPAPSAWYVRNLKIKQILYNGFQPDVLFKQNGSWPFVWRQAYRSAFLKEHGLLFDESIRFGEDTVFQLEAFPHGEKFSYIEDELYNYRWYRPGSLMSQYNAQIEEKRLQHLTLTETIFRYWEKQGWLELYKPDLLDWAVKFLIPKTPEPPLSSAYADGTKLLLEKYSLTQYVPSLSKESRRRLKQL